MPNIGPLELAIVAIIALVVFGPKRLPELGKSLGDGLREFKSSISGDEKEIKPPEIENGYEVEPDDEAPAEDAAPTPVASAKADTEAQTAPPDRASS